MKNFDELKVGDWFVDKDGRIDCIDNRVGSRFVSLNEASYDKDGQGWYTPTSLHVKYLIANPDLTPLPTPKKKVKKWQWVYKSGCIFQITSGFYSSTEQINSDTNIYVNSVVEPYIPSEIEVEE
jgi:hypothetical protein